FEEFFDFIFGQCCGKDAVLETVVVENVGITWRDYGAEAVVFHAPGSVLAAGAAVEIGAREQNRSAFVARKIQHKFRIRFFAGKVAPIVKKDSAKSFARQRL